MQKKHPMIWVFGFLFFLWGCSGDGSTTGTLKLSLTDAPACGFDEVNVTLSKIRIHASGIAEENSDGWSEVVLSPNRKINLTSLTNGVLEELGTVALPKGHYTQLRMVLVPNPPSGPLNNSVVLAGASEEIPLQTPSGSQSGVKLIHSFDVEADQLVDLVLDFDACKSVVRKGNGGYLLKPVISVTPSIVSGRITGVAGPLLSSGQPAINPVVTAQLDGKRVKSTVPDPSGNFVLSPLLQSSTAGNYDVVFTADNAATAMIQSVPVSAQQETVVSNSAGPITLIASSTHTVAGTVSPTEATIRATQTFSAALGSAIMEVRATNTADGNYTLLLPIDPPWLGQFGGTLPVTLTPDLNVAGQYDLEASAEGFPTKKDAITLTGNLSPHDFNLDLP